jgi:hypothetical protein
VRSSASADQLLALGTAIAVIDVGLVGDLGSLAMTRVSDDESRLAALHLLGIARAYSDRGHEGLALLDEAQRLAIGLGDTWQVAAISQMRAIALAGDSAHDAGAALAALESAARGFEQMGARTHAYNCRYMMALVSAENGVELDRAVGWAGAAAAYAEETANRHELAHAHLAQAMLGVGDTTPRELLAEFRAIGDLRCVFRSLMLLAYDVAPAASPAVFEEAVRVAETADDHRRRLAALTALARAAWEVGDRATVFSALDRIATTDGADAAVHACPDDLRTLYTPPTDAEEQPHVHREDSQ